MTAVTLISILVLGYPAPADGPNDTVRRILAEETRDVPRDVALKSLTSETAPPAVWWQSGHVQNESGWETVTASIQKNQGESSYTEYAERRDAVFAKPSVGGLLRLARWCRQNDRPDQHRLHLRQAMAADPSVATAANLRSIGFIPLGNQWVSPEVAGRVVRERAAIDRSLEQWGTQCAQIRAGLTGSPAMRQKARDQLASIESPEAVTAIELILGSNCERDAVQALARINSARSSLALASRAVSSPSVTNRTAAIEALKERQMDHFVPHLLELLVSDAVVETSMERSMDRRRWAPLALAANELALSVRVTQESRHQIRSKRRTAHVSLVFFEDLVHVELGGQAVFRHAGRTETPMWRLKLRQMMERLVVSTAEVHQLQRRVGEVNEMTRFVNDRVTAVLRGVSGESLSTPNEWWQWWNVYSDVDQAPKEVIEVAETTREIEHCGVSPSCFVAGTPVLTDTGLRPIDSIRPGDRVLSQDVETGELRFCVVEHTTKRPPRRVVAFTVGSETLRCTGGHQLWNTGAGWVKARDLKPGDSIRTPTRTAKITEVGAWAPTATYNLVVEGFHTYFVGEAGLLAQDVLPPAPTDMIAPGLSKFDLEE